MLVNQQSKEVLSAETREVSGSREMGGWKESRRVCQRVHVWTGSRWGWGGLAFSRGGTRHSMQKGQQMHTEEKLPSRAPSSETTARKAMVSWGFKCILLQERNHTVSNRRNDLISSVFLQK